MSTTALHSLYPFDDLVCVSAGLSEPTYLGRATHITRTHTHSTRVAVQRNNTKYFHNEREDPSWNWQGSAH